MQQQQQKTRTRPSMAGRHNIVLIMRIILFALTVVAILVTGILAMVTGSISPSTISSGTLTIILAILTLLQVRDIFFSVSPASGGPVPQPSSPGSTQNAPTPPVSASSVFYFNVPLFDDHELYGRASECATLIDRIRKGGSSSIVGERRVGKTWLLTYLHLVAPVHHQLGPSYRVAVMSAMHEECKHQAGFVQRALEALKFPTHSIDQKRPPLAQLAQGVRDLKQQGIMPVLCVDEFEGIDNKQEFTSEFFKQLRVLAQDEGLVLITASKRGLHELIEHLTGETSPLFNIVQQILLRPFTEHQAHTFVLDKSRKAGFNDKEPALFQRVGTQYQPNGDSYWPPARLQLSGQTLLDDKQAAQPDYQPGDAHYQSDFLRRVDEAYQAVVGRKR